MKALQPILLFCLSALLVFSCGINNDFSKRKYLNLKNNYAPIKQESKSLVALTIIAPLCDTIKLKNGDTVLAEINYFGTDSIIYNHCSEEDLLTESKQEVIAVSLNDVDTIIVDAKLAENSVKAEKQKKKKPRDSKKIAWIILRILLSIIIATAGILLGLQIMRYNKPDGSFLSKLWFVFVAIFAILLMVIATIAAIFLFLSVINL